MAIRVVYPPTPITRLGFHHGKPRLEWHVIVWRWSWFRLAFGLA